MTSQRWMLAFCFSLASVLGTGESVTTTEIQKYTCRTFGSGVIQPFNGSSFYVRSNCPFTLTRFTHNRVECDITLRRGDNGLLDQVEIIINKVKTIVQSGSIMVEKKSVYLPYDHTYQHIFQYGIYTRLRSSLLPLSVTWYSVPGGIDTVWVEVEQELSTGMTGLCGKQNFPGNKQQLIQESVLAKDTCQIRDPVSAVNTECRMFFSYTLDCLQAMTPHYIQLCEENIYSYEMSKDISCAFFKEVAQHCGNNSYVWRIWRDVTTCVKPSCPGDLVYVEQGAAFAPSCSSQNLTFSNQELTSSCVCPKGTVLNDHADGFHCVSVSSCSCVFAGQTYSTGDIRSTKCQSCVCDSGKWRCSENFCPPTCLIEGQFVTTFDGKQYAVPDKCTYLASLGLNWMIIIKFSAEAPSMKTVTLKLFQETYEFSPNRVIFSGEEITELHESEHALVFWQSSMYVHVHTSFGMKMEVQMFPEIQLYINPPTNHSGLISGLCGNNNNDTTDDFTTSSGIIENSAQPFAQSWSSGACTRNMPICINTDNEIFADEKCSVLNDPAGIFAKCHGHIPSDHYHMACILRTCNCGSSLQQCLCVALGNYAKACASLGVVIGDWRAATNCTLTCQKNLEFSYNMQACNHTCRSLSGPDPCCGLDDAPVEGCGCPEGTHLNQGHTCTPKAECPCHYYGGTTPPGTVAIDGRRCICENGELQCSEDCGCRNGKVCVHCSEDPVSTSQKTCDSLSKPMSASMTCKSGCYCPHDQYEDHRGNCVSLDNCTCVYSGKVFSAGQHVKTNCKTCICGQGQWHCRDEPCPGKCQVYGNGHYQTFDSKWYRFDGQCQYTLVEDDCGKGNGTFSVRVESVPCCDEALTCSRSIILDLQGEVTLTLSDMKVTRRYHGGWTLQEGSLYSTHTVGLYIIISVPSRGITLIWDKHTRITIELHEYWRNRVCGLCGNFDSNEMNDLQISGSAVMSSPLAFGNSWKAATPPCSDVTTEVFPCERNSYCSAWAQRRCRIITGDIFNECHLKVDPDPYYQACVQESCSCEFEGKFLGFCTAVAAYAEACSDKDVCVKWRTPDLCPVYCDYYNEQGQCSWHYETCGEMLTCGKDTSTHKLEGCYPRCSEETPYYDENTGECTKLRNCTCYFNDTVIQPGAVVMIQSIKCHCENGKMNCKPVCKIPDLNSTSAPTAPPEPPATTTRATTPTSSTPTTTASTTTETTVLYTNSTPTATTASTTAETTVLYTNSTPTATTASTTTETTVLYTTSTPTTGLTTAETLSATPPSTPTSTATNASTTTETTVLYTNSTPTATTASTTAETTVLYTNSTPTATTASTTTETTVLYTTSTPTTGLTTAETLSATPPSTPTSTATNASTTTETTVLYTTTTPTTTTASTTAETTVLYTNSTPTTAGLTTAETLSTTLPSTSTPTATNASTTAETTVLYTTTTPTTTTASTTAETTVLYTNSTPTTAGLTTAETLSTTPPSTSTPTATNASTTAETTVLYTTSTPTTTTASTTMETTVLYTNSTPTTTTGLTTAETLSTTPPSTSTPTTSITAVTSETLTKVTNATEITTSSHITSSTTRLSTTPSMTTAASTELTMITNSTTPHSTTTFVTNATSAETSGPTEVTITEASTETFTSSTHSTTQHTATSPETATSHEVTTKSTTMPPRAKTTEVSTSEGFANATFTTELTTAEESGTTMTTEKTYHTYHTVVTGTIETSATVTHKQDTESSSTTEVCKCTDRMKKQSWDCGETWMEDCFHKSCIGGKIELTPVACPEPAIPNCPRNQVTKVSDGCCERWECDCRCDLYGDPHYISFQGVPFDFLDDCTYILVEERSPRHHLKIAVDNFFCVPGLEGSCAKGIILKYQDSIATLSLIPHLYTVQATLNNVTIEPPYEEHGWRFETTGYIVSIYLPEIRSYVSLSPSYTLVVSLAMEHFHNNTQGQCGVCGVGSCIRKGGQMEDDSCCDKTAYDWVYANPLKPACASAPRDVPCYSPTTVPPNTPTSTPCPASALCELLHHPVFANCSVNLNLTKRNCEFDSCRNGPCSSLEQAAEECMKAGVCIDWRGLTNGSCTVTCPEGLVYRECHDKLDDVCCGGIPHQGASLENRRPGCYCPSGQYRAGNHSHICVSDCSYCKGPHGEPRLPGEVWQSGCDLCTCHSQTRTEVCVPKPPNPAPLCGPSAVLVNTSCCGDQMCVEKTCSYHNKTYRVGDRWKDAAHPCMTYTCSKEGIQTETRVCPTQDCPEEDRIWDDQHCCFSCNQSCAPRITGIKFTIENCTTVMWMPVCEGQCVSQPRVVLHGDLQVEQKSRCCAERSSERRPVTLRCFDLTTRHYFYKHITSCHCTTYSQDWLIVD